MSFRFDCWEIFYTFAATFNQQTKGFYIMDDYHAENFETSIVRED